MKPEPLWKQLLDFDVITNLGFSIVGVILMPHLLLMGIYNQILALGSGVHHHVRSRLTSYFDWTAMYLVFSGLFCLTVFGISIYAWLASLLMTGYALYVDIATKRTRRLWILGTICGMLLVAVIWHHGLLVAYRIIFNFALAFVARQAGGAFGNPLYKIFHGFWHILASHAILQTCVLLFGLTL